MAKDFFNAYHSYLKSMETLTDAECGRLFRACLYYSKSGTEPELRGNERFVFPTIRQQIDIDVEASKAKSETNRKNVLRRYTTVYDSLRAPTTAYENLRQSTREKEENEEKESPPCSPSSFPPHPPYITPFIPPKEKEAREEREPCVGRPVDERFDQFWQAYPKKVGKKDALKAFEIAKPTAELFSKMLKAIEAAKQSTGWQRENGRYIPNPSTWLNQGRWDDELTLPSPAEAPDSFGEDFDIIGAIRRRRAENERI